MSFALAYNADVLRAINALDPPIQEQILDEIDAVADGTILLPPRRRGEVESIHDFILPVRRGTLYVFVTILPEDGGRRLRIVSFGTYLRPTQ